MTESVFAKYIPVAYPNLYTATLQIQRIAGGTPTDPKVAEGWIRSKVGETSSDAIRAEVARVMIERAALLTAEPTREEKAKMEREILEEVNKNRHLNGMKREDDGTLYVEGRQVKAMIKESANIRWPKERWGPSRKGTLSFFAEHVFVLDDHISLGVTEPTIIEQRFVHTWRGSGIQYEEVVVNPTITFQVTTDHEFTTEQWALLWLTAEMNGLGATRSQGYGRFKVVGWEKVK